MEIGLSQSHCPQHTGTCVPMVWLGSRPRGTGDKGQRLPMLVSPVWSASWGGPSHPVRVTVALETSSSILRRSWCRVGLCHILGHDAMGRAQHGASVHITPRAGSGDKSWQGTGAVEAGRRWQRRGLWQAALGARPAARRAAWGPLALRSHMLRDDALCSPPAAFGCEPASAGLGQRLKSGCSGPAQPTFLLSPAASWCRSRSRLSPAGTLVSSTERLMKKANTSMAQES